MYVLHEKNIFLDYVVSTKGIEIYEEKIKAINERQTPKCIIEIRNFHDLASFYSFLLKNVVCHTTHSNCEKKMLDSIRALSTRMHLIILKIGCVLHLF